MPRRALRLNTDLKSTLSERATAYIFFVSYGLNLINNIIIIISLEIKLVLGCSSEDITQPFFVLVYYWETHLISVQVLTLKVNSRHRVKNTSLIYQQQQDLNLIRLEYRADSSPLNHGCSNMKHKINNKQMIILSSMKNII